MLGEKIKYGGHDLPPENEVQPVSPLRLEQTMVEMFVKSSVAIDPVLQVK